MENQKWVSTTIRFLSRSSLEESQELFNTLLRNEQSKRNAHILCLPIELRLHIIYLLYDNNIVRAHKNILMHLNVIQRNEIYLLRDKSLQLVRRWKQLKEKCEELLTLEVLNLALEDQWGGPLVILAVTNNLPPPHTGTSKGRHILAVVEDEDSWQLCENAEILVSQSAKISISVHKCALVAKHRQNPFDGEEEFISIRTNRVHKIWWVHIPRFFISCTV